MTDKQIELPPEQSVIPNIDENFELTDDLFMRWWTHLAEEDRSEFVYLYAGDNILARFVCMLDYLLIQKVQADNNTIIQLAYAKAAALKLNDPSIRSRAARAYKHDAVQALLDRLRYRSIKQRSMKIENNHILMMEKLQNKIMDYFDKEVLSEDDVKAVQATIGVVNKHLQNVSVEESRQRSERTRKGIAKAREQMATSDTMDARELGVFLKAATKEMSASQIAALIPDEVKALIAGK